MRPYISIITATFNAANDFALTARSIREIYSADFEWIIIDAGSTDGTLDQIKNNNDIITYWSSKPDKGIYDAWNKGLTYAQSDWVLFIGAGDIVLDLLPFLSFITSIHNEPFSYLVIYQNISVINARGEYLFVKGMDWQKVKRNFKQVMSLPHQGVLHHRRLFELYGVFDTSFKIAGDYEFLFRHLKDNPAYYIDGKPVVAMRTGGISGDPQNSWLILHEIRRAQVKNGYRIPGPIWLISCIRVSAREIICRILPSNLATKLLDFGRKIIGLPLYWSKI